MSNTPPGLVTPPNTLPEFLAGDTAVTETFAAAGGNFFVLANPGRNDYPNQNLLYTPNNTSEN